MLIHPCEAARRPSPHTTGPATLSFNHSDITSGARNVAKWSRWFDPISKPYRTRLCARVAPGWTPPYPKPCKIRDHRYAALVIRSVYAYRSMSKYVRISLSLIEHVWIHANIPVSRSVTILTMRCLAVRDHQELLRPQTSGFSASQRLVRHLC